MDKQTYWRAYHDAETLTWFDAHHTSHQIQSAGIRIHIDVYRQPAADAPLIIFNHGGGGYSRLFVPLAKALFEQGYAVVMPDQVGQGLSGGSWRTVTIPALVKNIVDVSFWAREQFSGKIFLAGASMGSGLVYYAAADGAPVDGVICHNLYRFDRPHDALALSSLSWATAVPGLPQLFASLTRLGAAIWSGLPLPYRLLGHFDRMVDRREADFYPQWKGDPAPLHWITLGHLWSFMSTETAVPLEQNRLPILVINPTLDEMVSPEVTQENYQRLGGPKRYVEIPFGHWGTSQAFTSAWSMSVDAWCRTILAAPAG